MARRNRNGDVWVCALGVYTTEQVACLAAERRPAAKREAARTAAGAGYYTTATRAPSPSETGGWPRWSRAALEQVARMTIDKEVA